MVGYSAYSQGKASVENSEAAVETAVGQIAAVAVHCLVVEEAVGEIVEVVPEASVGMIGSDLCTAVD